MFGDTDTNTATATAPDSYLVEHGARLDLVNCDGELPLDLAYQFAREGDASEPGTESEAEASDDEPDTGARRARVASKASSNSKSSAPSCTPLHS